MSQKNTTTKRSSTAPIAEPREYRPKEGAPIQIFMVRERKESLIADAADAVIQYQGVLCDAWSETWNLTYDLFPDFYLLQREIDVTLRKVKGLGQATADRIENLTFADRTRLVQSAYELGFEVGRRYNCAVDVRPVDVKGTFRSARRGAR